MLTYGIIKWKKRQNVTDKIQDEDLKSREIQNLSAQEKRDSIEKDIQIAEGENTESQVVESIDRQAEIDTYIQIENSIFQQLALKYKGSYNPSQNVRIENFEYDIILKSKEPQFRSDRIFEIKFFKKHLTYDIIKDAATKLILSSTHYEKNFKRNTIPTLIIIYSQDEFDENLNLYKKNITQFSKDLGKSIRIKFFLKNKIGAIKPDDFFNSIP